MEISIKEQLYSIIDELIKIAEGISEGIIKNHELNDAFSGNITKIYSLLEKDSVEYRKFDSWKLAKYGQTLYRLPREEEKYAKSNTSILDLTQILKDITMYKNIEGEKHFKVGEDFEIIRYLHRLFKSAKNEILIVDNYIDSNIFDFIDEIDTATNVKILTSEGKYKINFKNLYLKYTIGNLEVKIYNISNHDRYIILDKINIYLIGASLNGIGKSDFTIKKLDDLNKITDLYNLFEDSTFLK